MRSPVLRSSLPSFLGSPSLFFSQPVHAAGLGWVSSGPRVQSRTSAMRLRTRLPVSGVFVQVGVSASYTCIDPILSIGRLRNDAGRAASVRRHSWRFSGFDTARFSMCLLPGRDLEGAARAGFGRGGSRLPFLRLRILLMGDQRSLLDVDCPRLVDRRLRIVADLDLGLLAGEPVSVRPEAPLQA